jgi:hypothetical protein
LQQNGSNHPPGVLPPNGAMVYRIYDVNGYDSLAPRAYREFLARGEGADVSPPLNGNMILLENADSPALEQLGVNYVVSQTPLDSTKWKETLRSNGCLVYERIAKSTPKESGKAFSPGWIDGQYQPESFRLGMFISVLSLTICGFCLGKN